MTDATDPADLGAPPAPHLPDSTVFTRELTPTWLSTVALLAGQRPPELDAPMTWAHLGCGRGETAAVVAATHPDATVWAWDWRPDHIEQARRLRDGAGLERLEVHEWPDLPDELAGRPVDVVVVQDVLAASDDEQRRRVADAIRRSLRPGGLVCVTYPTLAGWAEIAPLQALLRELSLGRPQSPEALVQEGLELLGRLQSGGARFITGRPVVTAWLEQLRTLPPEEVAARYLRDPFRPLSPAQTAALLGDAGCSYVGSARLTDDLDLGLPDAVAEQLAGVDDPILRETYRDLARRTTYRLDVFRRGRLPLSAGEQAEAVADLALAGVAGPDAFRPAEVAPPVWDRLQREGLTAGALADDPVAADLALRVLLDGGHAHPVLTAKPTEAAVAACDGLNAHWTTEAPGDRAPRWARPELGTAVGTDQGVEA